MATQYSNKPIVTSGLVYALDFGNTKSYVSGSTIANSLKYETNLTFVTGSTSIPNSLSPVLFFTGSQWIERTGSFSVFNPNGAFTLSIVVNARTAGTLVSQTSSLGNLVSNVSPTSSAFGFANTNYTRGIQGLSPTQLNHLTYRYSSGTLDIFYNGTLITASQTTISLPTSSVVDEFYINGNNGLLNNFSGSLAAISVYNRSLTINEIQSNYILSKNRYGLTQEQNYTLDENAFVFLQSAGITDPIITGSIDTFVRGLKSASLWDKMIAIYPFVGTGSVGTNLTGSHRFNLKEPSLVTYPLSFTGSWIGSTSGSAPSGSNTNISTQVSPSTYYPFYNTQSAHISILSYDTPVSSSYLMGTGMTEDLAISTLAGDYGTPAAAYSVRKVRTAYTGALMDVRRNYDNVTQSIGFVSNGDLDTGSLLNFVREYSQSFAVTVINDGTANIFVLDGVNKPELTLFRGGVYTFNQSDATNSGHQIAFKSGSVSYTTGSVTTGTLGQAGAKTVLTVAEDAPDDLRYYCVAHGDYMGNTITVTANTGSGFVARWYDQSGNNRHATQTATGSQPVIVLSGSTITENTRSALSFNGIKSSATTLVASTLTSTDLTVFMLTKRLPNTSSLSQFPYPWTIGNAGISIGGGSNIRFFTPNGVAAHTFGNNSFGQELISFTNYQTAPYISAFVNNNQQTFATTPPSPFSYNGTLSIGGPGSDAFYGGTFQELLFYPSSQLSNILPVNYGINNYYNIYPQTSSFATSSFTIQATPTGISGSINNRLTSGIPSTGPLGLITVSRTGSNSLTIARNGVTSSFAVPASGALSTGIFLGAINNNGLALGNSPLNISFASVGTGLTGAEVNNLSALTLQLQYRLTSRRLPPISNGLLLNLDASSKTSYPGSGSIWFDISGNNYNGNLVNGAIFDPLNEGSLVFNGINNYVLNTSFNITPVNNELAISMWYKTNNNANEKMLIDLCNNSARDLFSIRQNWNTGNKISCYFNSTTGFVTVTFPNQVITNTWNNIVYSKVGNTINAYLNGELVNTSSVTGNIQTIQRYIIANDNLLASNLFSGNIANVLIYNRGLSPQEVLQNFNTNRVRFGI